MILGPNYNFIAVPRTASVSISAWLVAHFGGQWHGDGHGTDIPEDRKHLFTFAVVRNPYTRLPSLYRYVRDVFWSNATWRASDEARAWLRLGMPFDAPLAEWVRWATKQRGHQWCSQAAMLKDVRLDAVLRFERLRELLGLLPFVTDPSVIGRLPHIGETVREALSKADISAIIRHSDEDFARFDYSLEYAGS